MRARPTSSLRLCPLLLQLHPHPCNQFLVNVAAVTAVQLQEQRAADHQGTTLAAPAPVSPSSAPPAPGEASDPAGRQPQHGLPLPQCRPLFPIFLPSPSPSKGRSRVMSLARRPSLPWSRVMSLTRRPSLPSFGSLNIDDHPPSPPPGPPPPPPPPPAYTQSTSTNLRVKAAPWDGTCCEHTSMFDCGIANIAEAVTEVVRERRSLSFARSCSCGCPSTSSSIGRPSHTCPSSSSCPSHRWVLRLGVRHG